MSVWHLVRPVHVRARGMRIGAHEIALWSFLMSLAHGAGLMVLPLVLADGAGAGRTSRQVHAAHASAGLPALSATAMHTLGYLLAMALVPVVVSGRLGCTARARCGSTSTPCGRWG